MIAAVLELFAAFALLAYLTLFIWLGIALLIDWAERK